ncbi:MAG: HAD hydrolase-like protein [Lachnospiraceae bacterium]|nr:HAD hydrolase-like protein [Lachnospiraceae bacterium]MDE6185382.1 HAD hydrolase-like protein [Lachnospiraceae bacterium]
MFQYCLFDLDGTLTDSKEGITKSVQYALQKFGIKEPDLDKLEPFIGPPLKDSFVEFYGLSEGDVIKAVAYYRERYASKGVLENQIFPGMAQMLDMLCEKGIHLAVASSKPIEFVRQILAHFEIEQYFEVIVGSGLDGSRATKEEVVEEALSQLGLLSVPKEERKEICAMIGDRKFDIQGAKAFGLTGVGVRFGFASEGELEAEGADYIINSVEELGLFLTQ